MPSPIYTTTRAMAELHEVLWLEMSAVKSQLGSIAARRPTDEAGETVREEVQRLFDTIGLFIRHKGEARILAARDYATLSIQVARALARLDHWESLHTSYDARYKCPAWQFRKGSAVVTRYRPSIQLDIKPQYSEMTQAEITAKLNRLFARKRFEDFRKGYKIGLDYGLSGEVPDAAEFDRLFCPYRGTVPDWMKA